MDTRVHGPWTRPVDTGVTKMTPVNTARGHGYVRTKLVTAVVAESQRKRSNATFRGFRAQDPNKDDARG